MESIFLFDIQHGPIADFRASATPTSVWAWQNTTLRIHAHGTHYGYVADGPASLEVAAGRFLLPAGMYFAVPGGMTIEHGQGLIVTRHDYLGFFQLGGPMEDRGRLRYIDGCTDSLLIPPVVQGDPCLNFLQLPPLTRQTPHTHPSLRVGMIVSGEGVCVTARGRLPLAPRVGFVIGADQLHHFETTDAALRIVAYHPDSDWGPTHADHPMLNRTILRKGGADEPVAR